MHSVFTNPIFIGVAILVIGVALVLFGRGAKRELCPYEKDMARSLRGRPPGDLAEGGKLAPIGTGPVSRSAGEAKALPETPDTGE